MIPFDLLPPAPRRQPSELQSAKPVELCVRTFPLPAFPAFPALSAFLTVCLCILLAGCPGPKFNPPPSVTPSPTPTPTVTPVPTPTPTPTPLPEAIIPYSHKEVAPLFFGGEGHFP